MTFETTGKFLIVFVRLIFGKAGVDGFTGTRRKVASNINFILSPYFRSLSGDKDF